MIRMVGPTQGQDGARSSGFAGRCQPPPFQEVLGCLDGAYLVIDETFRILNANDRAMILLGGGPDQTDFGRYIVGGSPAQSEEMRKRTRAAITSGDRAVLLINHPQHRRLICSVKPVRQPDNDESYGLLTLMAFDEVDRSPARFLRDIYMLTKSEAEIAAAAAEGAEVAQIAVDRGVSIHTLRAQVASIKTKMGLKRMTEIAVVVARISAAATLI